TVLMRLARGSGLDGLAGMASASATPWPLFRPLLGVTRQRLKATLQAAGQGWIDDPSNDDERFERIRMRKALSALAPLGVDAGRIAVSARRLGRASQALDLAAGTLKQSAFVGHRAGFGEIDLATYMDAPDELRIRLLQMLVWQFGSHDMPRLAALERLSDWIADGQGRARTIAGCRIARRKRTLLIGREPGRIAAEPMQLDADGGCAEGVWDRRFRFRVSGARAKDVLSVVPFFALRAGNRRQTGDETAAMPAFVRAGLPALLNHGEMHSVPHLGITGPPSRVRLSVDVVFFNPNEVRPR
ncbi:MAG: ATP-binding protein, partial [Aestuariivirgaceae bacterium]